MNIDKKKLKKLELNRDTVRELKVSSHSVAPAAPPNSKQCPRNVE